MPSAAHTSGGGRPVIIIGCGGHAVVLIGALRAADVAILAAADDDPTKAGTSIAGVSILGGVDAILGHDAREILLVNGIGSTGDPRLRRGLFERFKKAGYEFATVIHPSAVVADDAVIGEGVQIMAGAVVQPRCRIGANTLINTRAGVDHDAHIGEHVHVAPGATLCGEVSLGDGCHIGAGATVIQGAQLAAGCIVGAGAVVVRSVDKAAVLCGVPAKPKAP